MKKLLAIFLLFPALAFSQDRFVEVKVSDTITLKAISFVYEISETSAYDDMYDGDGEFDFGTDGETDSKKEKKEDKRDLDDIKELLKKERIVFSETNLSKYAVNNNKLFDGGKKIYIHVTSENDLKRLYQLLKDETTIKAQVTEVNYEPIEKYYEKLYDNLYKKGLNKANIIASKAASKAGKLISASDVFNNVFDYEKMYKDAFRGMAGSGLFNSFYELNKVEELDMMFKFELIAVN